MRTAPFNDRDIRENIGAGDPVIHKKQIFVVGNAVIGFQIVQALRICALHRIAVGNAAVQRVFQRLFLPSDRIL